MSIKAQNLEKSYGTVKALHGISLEVSPGELFGLIGPDGAGKTTLLRILTTLLLPDLGTAAIHGFDTVKDYKQIRNITGYMPGRFSLYQDLSVEENLQFFASIFDQKFDENFELIRDIYIQLAPFKKRLAGRLSGGMKQKLALCCALIHKPEILVLDEPTTGVDAVSRNEFWNMLSNLKKEGITIIVSTPYMDEATRCDRIALIQKGKILQIDTPQNIVAAFGRKLFSVRTADLYRGLLDLKSFGHTHAVYPFGQYLHFVSSNNELNPEEIQHYLDESGHKQIEIHTDQPNIEDCFMELMHHAR
jgi:ABC-2 type transport system ATP-binding protein